MEGSNSIYREIKKFRGICRTVTGRIDEVVGSDNIANHFAGKYCHLYNQCTLGDAFENLTKSINDKAIEESMEEIDKVTPGLVREALKRMKSGKSDVLYEFNSDCLLNAPEVLLDQNDSYSWEGCYHFASLFSSSYCQG